MHAERPRVLRRRQCGGSGAALAEQERALTGSVGRTRRDADTVVDILHPEAGVG